MRILLVGGAGYVGSHVARECLRANHVPIVFDNFSTGHKQAVAELTQIESDLLDRDALRRTFEKSRFDAVLHFAAPDAASLSLGDPVDLYRHRLAGTLNLLDVMREANVQRLIFCSTAAVYGQAVELPIRESHSRHPIDPWGRAMLMIEELLADRAEDKELRYIALRTFCVGGADPWGDLGDDRPGQAHLIQRLLLTALRQFDSFAIFGGDFDTQDGTCVRDFVHVSDVATAHILALEAVDHFPNQIINLGSGVGYSVREVLQEAQRIAEARVPVTLRERRAADPPVLVASGEKARAILEWEPVYSDLHTILETAWYWHKRNPQGYEKRDVFLDRDRDPDLSPEL